MPKNKHLRFLLITVYIIIGYFFVTKILPNFLSIFLPFILAALVALITRPFVRLFKKLKLPNLPASLLSLVLVLAMVSGIIYAIINRLVSEITLLSKQLPAFISSLPYTLEQLAQRWYTFNEALSPEMSHYINESLLNLSNSLVSLITPATQKILNAATDIAGSLPNIFVFTVAFLLSCVFFTKDYDFLTKSIAHQFPKSILDRMTQIKGYTFIALGKYLKGVAIMLSFTFAQLLAGFLIINIPYAFILALVVAFVDALPTIGTGAILIPWGIIELLFGQYRMGISLIVLYFIIFVIRQLLEPKVMSSSLGIYPVLTLVGMYAGLSLFGFIGLIFAPIIIAVIVYMQKAGLFVIWKTSKSTKE
ncbi:MAG: sporulation integral membrane protein YtvI [Clostridiaceae bacterium]|jgi:sporulation integral membrane protein YtvI|nr:sporulation integral membrane protein YtvI [Clostridiaceae bacterium]